MNLEDVEKYYENKFSEKLIVLQSKQKAIKNIEHLDQQIQKKKNEKDNYIITKPVRNLSLFNNKCKYHGGSCVKDNDRLYFSKYGTCYNCYVMYEER